LVLPDLSFRNKRKYKKNLNIKKKYSTKSDSSSSEVWKKELVDQYRKHEMVRQHLLKGKEVDLDILNKVLGFSLPAVITEEHLLLCLEIYNKRITLGLPVPRSEFVKPFTELVGKEKVEEGKEISGCYYIKAPFKGRSNITGLLGIESYVGQAKHLGDRVKNHAKGADSSTKSFVSSLKGKGLVDLFIVDKDLQIPGGLTRKQFITLLEQYLIMKLKPTINKKLLATPGVMWSPEAINKHLEKVGHPVYAYHKEEDGKMILVQIFPSTRAVGTSLDFSPSFYSSVKSRTNGWFKDQIYFSEIELDNAESNLLSLLNFKELVGTLGMVRMGFKIRVTDVTTEDEVIYPSMGAVTRAIGIDPKGIREKSHTGKLYKGKYRFEIV